MARIAPVPAVIASLALLLLAASPAAGATLNGFLRSADSGEPLAGAGISIPALRRGALANASGFYVLPGLPAGTLRVTFAMLGYRPETREVTLAEGAAVTLSLELVLAPPEVSGIEVVPDRATAPLAPGTVRLESHDLARLPAVGEADLFRAIQSLPGVSTLSDYSAGLYVRGGSPDQNLVLLDDLDVYNPSHLFGFFSTFNVDAVNTVDLQESGFPAPYGGRLSSLLDVHNREGNRKRLRAVVRSGLIASSTTLEGPWQRGSWMVSGRLTHLGPLTRAVHVELPYGFRDLQSRVNWDLGPGDRASLSYYAGRDRLDWNDRGLQLDLGWGNETWSGQWTHVFTPRLFSHTVVGHSRFDSGTSFDLGEFAFRDEDRIGDWSLKQRFSWTPAPRHQLDFGGEAKRLDFSFRTRAGGADPLTLEYRGTYAAAYAQDAWRISDAWRVRAGLRVDHYEPGGYWRVDPRVTAERALGDHARLHATYGRYHQFLNLVSREGASFADMWFPVDATLRPGQADHWILGLELGPWSALDLDVEAYLKPYANLVQYSQEFQRSLVRPGAHMDELFDSGTGRASGVDVYLRDHWRGFEGWLGYSLGRSVRTIRGINFDRPFPADFDRRHQVVLVQSHSLGRGWRASATFHYGTGEPLTLPVGRYTAMDATGRTYDLALAGERNTSRMPDYQRLDLALSARMRLGGWTVEPEIEVVNAYDHRNVWIRTYDTAGNPARFSDIIMLPLLPTAGIRVEF